MVQGKCRSVSYKSKKNKPIPEEQWIRVERIHEPDLWNTVQEMIKQKAKFFPMVKLEFCHKIKIYIDIIYFIL